MTDEEALAKAQQAFTDARSGGGSNVTEQEILKEVRRRRNEEPDLFEALARVGQLMQQAQQGQ